MRAITLLVFIFHLSLLAAFSQVKAGADLLFERHFFLVHGKRVGLVTNHTALMADGRHLADALHERPAVSLVVLFGPEHGIRGDAPAGETIDHGRDEKTGVPTYSLYGAIRKPTPEMLKDVDVVLYDIQDVGARFYTYISTLSYAMEAAAEKRIPFIVLDRPNPIRGTWVEGFVRDDSLSSFVGLHPIPIAYGMTAGELAVMINEEGRLSRGIRAELTVVKMEGWEREMWYDQTGLQWIAPSPNIKTLESATVYPGTCLFEGTNLSEGRGTDQPFEIISAPFLDGALLAEELNSQRIPGVRFQPVSVIPRNIPGAAMNPKFLGENCSGVRIEVMNRNIYEPVATAIRLLASVRRMYPDRFQWRTRSIDLLSGTPRFRRAVDEGSSADRIISMWRVELEAFKGTRKKYLMY